MSGRRVATVLPFAVLLLVSVGCARSVAGQGTANGSAAGSGAGSSTASTTPSAAGRTEVATGLTGFTSPSGNIGCQVDETSARCDIAQHSWQAPPKPADCTLSSGSALSVEDTAGFPCVGDSAMGSPNQLAYGDALRVGVFTCTSRETGVQCENSTTKHGFVLARDSYRLY
jgi:hypothetical protein